MIWIGIDPGLDGGIVAIDERGEVRLAERMPTLGTGKRILDLVTIRGLLWPLPNVVTVGVEIQNTRPRDGRVSAFKTGKGYGELIGLLTGMGQRYKLIQPREWQASVCRGLPKLDTKARTIMAVEAAIPSIDLRPGRCTKPHTGIADAAGIALYLKGPK